MKRINFAKTVKQSINKKEKYTDSVLYTDDKYCNPYKIIRHDADDVFEEIWLYCAGKSALLNSLNKNYKNNEILTDSYIESPQRIEKLVCKYMNCLRHHPNGYRAFPDGILRTCRIPIEIKAVSEKKISTPSFGFKEINDYIKNTWNNPINLFSLYDIHYYHEDSQNRTQIIGNTIASIWNLTGPATKKTGYISFDSYNNGIRPVQYWNVTKTFNDPYKFVRYITNTAYLVNKSHTVSKSGELIDIRAWEKRMCCYLKKNETLILYLSAFWTEKPIWMNKIMKTKLDGILKRQKFLFIDTDDKLEPAPYEKFAIHDITENKFYSSTKEWVKQHKHFSKNEHAVAVRVDAHLHDRTETCYGHLLSKIAS